MKIHVVQKGDSLLKIAKKYQVEPNVLKRANDHLNPESLKPGMKVKVPTAGVPVRKAKGFKKLKTKKEKPEKPPEKPAKKPEAKEPIKESKPIPKAEKKVQKEPPQHKMAKKEEPKAGKKGTTVPRPNPGSSSTTPGGWSFHFPPSEFESLSPSAQQQTHTPQYAEQQMGMPEGGGVGANGSYQMMEPAFQMPEGYGGQQMPGSPQMPEGYGGQQMSGSSQMPGGYGGQQMSGSPQMPEGFGGQQMSGSPQMPGGYGGQHMYGSPQMPGGYGGQQMSGSPQMPEGYGGQQMSGSPQMPEGYGGQQMYGSPQMPGGYGGQQMYGSPQMPGGYGGQQMYGSPQMPGGYGGQQMPGSPQMPGGYGGQQMPGSPQMSGGYGGQQMIRTPQMYGAQASAYENSPEMRQQPSMEAPQETWQTNDFYPEARTQTQDSPGYFQPVPQQQTFSQMPPPTSGCDCGDTYRYDPNAWGYPSQMQIQEAPQAYSDDAFWEPNNNGGIYGMMPAGTGQMTNDDHEKS